MRLFCFNTLDLILRRPRSGRLEGWATYRFVIPGTSIVRRVKPWEGRYESSHSGTERHLRCEMATLRIYDYDNGMLALDLRHLLDLFVPCSLQATWTVSPLKLFCPPLNSFLDNFSPPL